MQVWNVLHTARWKCWTQKIVKNSPSGHHRTTLSGYIFKTKARIDNRKENLLNSNVSPTCSYNMVNFGPLAAEIVSLVWDTPANVNGFRVLAALLPDTLVVGVSQTLRHWTEGATYPSRWALAYISGWSCYRMSSRVDRSCDAWWLDVKIYLIIQRDTDIDNTKA